MSETEVATEVEGTAVTDPVEAILAEADVLAQFAAQASALRTFEADWAKGKKSAGHALRKLLLDQFVKPATDVRKAVGVVRTIARDWRKEIHDTLKAMPVKKRGSGEDAEEALAAE